MMNHRADTLDESLEAEAMVTPFLMDTEDFKEGVKAFMKNAAPILQEDKKRSLTICPVFVYDEENYL